jgi:1,4-dihydroxy-2-naphthoate polyprenyltransferase
VKAGSFISVTVAFIRLGRPHFLAGGFLLYALGAAVAVAGGAKFDLAIYLFGQAAITAVQLMTHYANDYFDLAADQANATPTRWSGGSRVLAEGALPPWVALATSVVLAATALTLAGILAARGGPADTGGTAAASTILAAGILAWFYSAPPVALHSRGLGEVTTAIVVTGLTPLCGFLGTAGGWTPGAPMLPVLGLTLLPLAALQFAMLLTIEFPDAAGDAAVGKRTLVVRWGAPWAAAVCRAVLVAVYGVLPLLVWGHVPVVVVLGAAVGSPIAAWQFWRLGAGAWADSRRWESLGFWAVALLVTTTVGELAAFLWIAVGH